MSMPDSSTGPVSPLPGQPRPRPRPAVGVLRQRAEHVIRARRAPTQAIGIRGDEDGPSDQRAREVIDLCLRIGELLLGSGASASDVTSTLLRLARAYGVRSLHVDVTYTSITVSYHRGPFRDPMTVMRIVDTMAADFSRLEAVQALVRRIVQADDPGELEVTRESIDRIIAAHHPYRRIVVTLALALLGGAVAALLGGGLLLVLISAVCAAVVDRVQRSLSLWGVPAFFAQAVGAAIPTAVAVAFWQVAAETGYDLPQELSPSLIVATGVVVLLAGLSVVSVAQDTLDGYYVSASGRAFEVLVLTGGVAAGVLAVLGIATRLNVPIVVSTRALSLSGDLVVELLAATLVAAANAVAAYTGPRAVLYSAGVGAVGWVAFRIGTDGLDLPLAAATALSALVVGAVATWVSFVFRVPGLALITGGIVPLLPGLSVYRGILGIVQQGPTSDALGPLVLAASIGMAIAGGVSLGALPVRRAFADRVQRRLLRRSAADTRD